MVRVMLNNGSTVQWAEANAWRVCERTGHLFVLDPAGRPIAVVPNGSCGFADAGEGKVVGRRGATTQ